MLEIDTCVRGKRIASAEPRGVVMSRRRRCCRT